GKVDRRRLLENELSTAAQAPAAVNGQPELETELMPIWCKLLRRDEIGPTDSFYALGGDSLTGARLSAAVRQRFGVGIPLDQLRPVDSIRAMAAHLAGAMRAPAHSRASVPGNQCSTNPLAGATRRTEETEHLTRGKAPVPFPINP